MSYQRLRILTVLLVMLAGCTGRPRSEAWMRRHFADNRAKFDKLVAMANEDYRETGVTRIAYDFTRLKDNWQWPREKIGLTSKRWDEYRKIFHKLQLPAGLDRIDDDGHYVTIYVYGVGMAGEGSEYGYLWCSIAPKEYKKRNGAEFTVKNLDGNWYIYNWVIP